MLLPILKELRIFQIHCRLRNDAPVAKIFWLLHFERGHTCSKNHSFQYRRGYAASCILVCNVSLKVTNLGFDHKIHTIWTIIQKYAQTGVFVLAKNMVHTKNNYKYFTRLNSHTSSEASFHLFIAFTLPKAHYCKKRYVQHSVQTSPPTGVHGCLLVGPTAFLHLIFGTFTGSL